MSSQSRGDGYEFESLSFRLRQLRKPPLLLILPINSIKQGTLF